MKSIISLLLSLAAASTASASLLGHEPFDYVVTSPITGNAGTGWTSAWTFTGASGSISAPGLAYTDAAGGTLLASGLSATTQGGTATTQNFRSFPGTGHADLWISFLYQLPASNSNYEGVTFYRAGVKIFSIQNSSVDTTASIGLRDDVGNVNVTTGKGVFGRTHLVVLHLTDGAGTGGKDKIEAFIDPVLGQLPTTADATVSVTNQDFDSLRLAGQNGSALLIDEIRLGTSYADVTPMGPDIDSDGDGLTNRQEILLGLDPYVSNAALVAAVKENGAFFGLFTTDQILATTGGRTIAADAQGNAALHFTLKKSADLSTWTEAQSYTRSIALPAGKNFLRLTMETAR